MINKNNHRINIVLPKKLHQDFVSAYPSTLSIYIRNALNFAVKSKKNFDFIFFRSFEEKK